MSAQAGPTAVDYAAAARTLTAALGLAEPPVAVCLVEEAPAGLPGPPREATAGCAFWADARAGAFVTAPRDHERCAIGTFTHSLETGPAHEGERRTALRVFADLGYVRPEDLPRIPVLRDRPRHIVYAPLAETPAPPDVVLLFARPDQLLVLVEASQSLEGGLPPAMGRPACAVVPQVRDSARAALSLGCCGARAYLDTFTPGVALYAVPGARLTEYAERVRELAGANRTLTAFHRGRRRDVEAGRNPTIEESLAAASEAPAG